MNITFLIGHLVKERDLILYELAEDLAKNGGDVTVISGYPSRRITDEVRKHYHEMPVETINDHFTSIRVGTKKGEGNGLLVRMIRYLALSRRIINKAVSVPTDVYYIYSTPPFLGYYISRLKKVAPVLYNAQDLFPDSLITAKKLSEKNPIIRFFRRLEKKVYDSANTVVTISEDMRDHILELGGTKEKVFVINNWADTTSIYPIEKKCNRLFDEYHLSRDCFTVLYAGDIGLHQRLNIFPKIAKELLSCNLNVQFVFFGNGAYAEELKKTISDCELTNFIVLPLQDVSRIAEVYSVGDIDIVSLESGMTKIALPSKVWSVMAAGRPVLGLLDENSKIAEEINGKYGYIIDGMAESEIAELLKQCVNRKEELAKMGQFARNEVCMNNCREKQTREYFLLLKQTSKNKNNV